MPADPLILQIGKHKCTCGEMASRLVRCPKCKAIIARCGTHGGVKAMADLQRSHC